MKTLENKTTKVPFSKKRGEGDEPIRYATYADLARLCVDAPIQGGFNATDIRKRWHLIDALDAAEKSIELEDADVELLIACVKPMRWGLNVRDFVTFEDDVLALADQS